MSIAVLECADVEIEAAGAALYVEMRAAARAEIAELLCKMRAEG